MCESFELMLFNIYSFDSLFEKDFHILSNFMNLFFNGLIAAYMLYFKWIIFALSALLFFVVYIFFLSSSNIVNEIFGLFVSNFMGVVLLKLYLPSYGFSFDILSGWKEMS